MSSSGPTGSGSAAGRHRRTRWFLDELVGMLAGHGLAVPPEALGRAADASSPGWAPSGWAALDWASSGLMWLTGSPDRAPVVPDGPVLERADAAARLLAALSTRTGRPVRPDVAELLGGRAALMRLHRRGSWSAGGSCRLMRCADGWLAVNLARPHDVDAVDALLGALGDPVGLVSADPCLRPVEQAWAALEAALPTRAGAEVVELARLLAIPVSLLPGLGAGHDRPSGHHRSAGHAEATGVPPLPPAGPRAGPAAPVVVDLSAMWAGPLCAHLLGRMGMRVVKVESVHRPDGARRGEPAFYDWLHAGHSSVALDFTTTSGRAMARHLVERADVVIEASRPRALAQLGLDAEALVAARPGLTWVGITGYGRGFTRAHPGPDPVAFGDDAAVAGGLVAWDRAGPGGPFPVFCADAIADPLTGLYAALLVAASVATGGSRLLDVAMRDVASFAGGPPPADPGDPGRADRAEPGRPRSGPWTITGSDQGGWVVRQADRAEPVARPRPPLLARPGDRPASPAAALGADTRAVLDALHLG